MPRGRLSISHHNMSVSSPRSSVFIILFKTKLQHPVQSDLFDYNFSKRDDYSAISDCLSSFQPDFIGITVVSFILYDVYQICIYIKKNFPSIKIILGGKHLDIYPEITLKNEFVDFIISGEGEVSLTSFLEAYYAGNQSFSNIPGLWYKNNGMIIDGKHRE
jgi:radical SAM superfamily enzyme YgiQ (UPF0313 family)